MGVLFLVGCSDDTPAPPAMPIAPGTMSSTSITSAPIPTAAPTPPEEDPEWEDDDGCTVYRLRCTPACKNAFLTSVSQPGNHWNPESVPPDIATQLGTCIAGCDQNHADDVHGCVGAATQAECDCQEQCFATAKASGRVSLLAEGALRDAARNLDAAISPACR